MFNMYRQLIAFMLSLPALQIGKYRRLKTDNPDIYAFMRGEGNNRCVIVINFSQNEGIVSVEGNHLGVLLCSTHSVYGRDEKTPLSNLRLGGFEGQLYEIMRPT